MGGVVEVLGQAREHPPELARTYFERRSGAIEAELEQATDLYRFADDRRADYPPGPRPPKKCTYPARAPA